MAPVPTVPQTLQGEVVGIDGRVLVTTAGDVLTLCVVRPSERALVVLDLRAVAELRGLLLDAEAPLAPATPGRQANG